MKQKSGPGKAPAEQVLKDIRRQTRRQCSAEEKIRTWAEPSSAGDTRLRGAPKRTPTVAYSWLKLNRPSSGRAPGLPAVAPVLLI